MNTYETKVEITETRFLPVAEYIAKQHNNPAKGAHLKVEGNTLRIIINDERPGMAENRAKALAGTAAQSL